MYSLRHIGRTDGQTDRGVELLTRDTNPLGNKYFVAGASESSISAHNSY